MKMMIVGLVLTLGVAGAAQAQLAKAIASFDEGKYNEARATILDAEPISAEGYYYLGRVALELGDHDDAIDEFKRALELDDGVSEYHRWLGMGYVEKLDHSSFIKKKSIAGKIKQSFITAVEKDTENLDARVSLAHFYFEAPGFVGGNQGKAVEQIEFVISRDQARGLTLKGDFHAHIKEHDKAAAAYLGVAELTPEDPMGWYQLGILHQTTENWDGAYKAFDKALEVDPDHMNSIYQLGRTAVFSGTRVKSGESALKRYLTKEVGENEPSHANAHWRLGMLYENAQREDDAKVEYEIALSMEPNNEGANKSLKRLKKRNSKLRRR